jgi:phenylacetic acid degradation protein PaaD
MRYVEVPARRGSVASSSSGSNVTKVSGFERERIAGLLADDAYANGLGVELVDVSDEEIVVAMEVDDSHTNFLGGGHGGVVFSLADCAFSLASNSAGDPAVAIDTHLVLTAASRPGDRLEARVRELSRGRTLGTYRAEVTRGDGRMVALFTGTVYINSG